MREYLSHAGHVSLDLVQFGLEIESDLDAFPKSPDYKYILYDIRKRENVITFCNNTLAQRRP